MRGGIAALFGLAVVYCIAAFGIPLGVAGTLGVAAAIAIAVVFRGVELPSSVVTAAVVALSSLIVMRIVIGFTSSPTGWIARYHANETWSGEPRWSADFRLPSATRIDSRISFRDDTFPAHYLNDYDFTEGIRREVSEPMSIEWTGYVTTNVDRLDPLSLTARGLATVEIDGRQVLRVAGSTAPAQEQTTVHLAAGPHVFVVRYAKPPDTDGLIELAFPLITSPEPGWRAGVSGLASGVRRGCDAVMLFIAAALALYAGVVSRRAGTLTRQQVVPLALMALFGIQGWWQANRFANRVVSLNPGDDWFGYESYAREILAHGPLMTFGKPLGEGAPYFWHPLYTYFLAAVHALTGESLFGPVFVQFLILAAVAVMMWRFAERHFGEMPALAGLFALVVIFELDFARYYTVTLLTENLYILTVTLTLLPFARWADRGETGDLVRAAFWAGVSSITRPAMMFYFVPALVLIAFVAMSRSRRPRAAVVAAALAASVWLLVIAPVTARNWVVSNRFVLISDVSSRVFDLLQHMPPSILSSIEGVQASGPDGSLALLARVAWEHPIPVLLFQLRKLGFAAGMTQWFGGYSPHPELIGITLLYAVMLMASPRLRGRSFWPIHLFALTHLGTMMLTLPWNYGYRLIIPPYVYMSTLSVASLVSLAMTALHGRRDPTRSPEEAVAHGPAVSR